MATDDKVKQQLAALAAAFAGQLPGRIDEIAAQVDLLSAGGDVVEAVEGVRSLAHKLAGAGATFGLPPVSEAARALENLCQTARDGQRNADEAFKDEVETAFEELKRVVEAELSRIAETQKKSLN